MAYGLKAEQAALKDEFTAWGISSKRREYGIQ